jgi:hypothetical protein
VNLSVHQRGRAREARVALTKCKLHLRQLTLAPEALGHVQSEEEVGEIDEEADRILTHVHLHRAVEVAIESSLSHRTGPHAHGVNDRLHGHFWASGIAQIPSLNQW